MFEKEVIAIDITSTYISILIGHKYKISNGIILETPKGSYKNDNIEDVTAIANVIGGFLNKCKVKEVSFVLRGQDLITRHMHLPALKEEALADTVEFELRQFVGDRVDELYFDYEIIATNKDENTNTNTNHIFVAAVEKTKVDNYLKLAENLKLKVKSIDVYGSVAARVIRNMKQSSKSSAKTIGIIDIEADANSISLLEWDKLRIERYNSSGILNGTYKDITSVMDYNSLLDNIDLIEVKEVPDDMDNNFENMIKGYNSIIQYYATGKIKKNLDRLFIMGSATRIKGISQYVEVSLNTKVNPLPAFKDLKNSVKAPRKIELSSYIYPYGLLLRRE